MMTNSRPYMVEQTMIAGMYRGASLAWNTCAPIQFPVQYAIKSTVPVTDFFVRPAMFEGTNV
jgi:hypothetical protein